MLPKKTKSGHPSLRQRLLTAMAAGFVVIIAIISIGLWSYANKAANQSYDRLLTGASLAILERTSLNNAGARVDIPYSALEMVGLAKEDRVFYRIFTPDGVTLTGDPSLPLPKKYKPSSSPQFFDDFYSAEKTRFILQARLLTGSETSDWIIVQIGQTRRARSELENDLIISGLSVFILITAIGLIFVWVGINRVLHPLIGIEKNLRYRESTDFTELKATPPREVESLVGSINGFIRRLKLSLDHSQVFIADVAHQTRTSLSALQGQLDLAARQSDPEAMRERLLKADQQAQRTIRLTNQLLAHAMVIHRADNQPKQLVDLQDLTRKTMEETLREQVMSEIEFEVFMEEPKSIPELDKIIGDPIAIREALRNLLDNAIKHGPDTNKIDVRVESKMGEMSLIVEDAGPGLSPELYAAALERFQSFAVDGRGSGLGLAIVHSVVLIHNAKLTLGGSPNGGLRVEIAFPKAGLA